jgi:hypothetical protein
MPIRPKAEKKGDSHHRDHRGHRGRTSRSTTDEHGWTQMGKLGVRPKTIDVRRQTAAFSSR